VVRRAAPSVAHYARRQPRAGISAVRHAARPTLKAAHRIQRQRRRHQRQQAVFRQPIGGKPFRVKQRKLERQVRRAAQALPRETRLPQLPVLRHYTAPQRRTVQRLYGRSIRRVAKQSGETPSAASVRLYQQADARTRREFRQTLGRAARQSKTAQRRAYERKQVRSLRRHPTALGPGAKSHLGRREALSIVRQLERGNARVSRGDKLKQPTRKTRESGKSFGGGPSSLPEAFIHGIHPVTGMGLEDVAHAAGKLGAPIAKDALQLAANAPAGAYNLAAAGVEAFHGDTHRAKRLWKSYTNTDPLALAIQGRGKEALQAVAKHPVVAVLDVSGAKALVGRSIGRAERLAGHNPARGDAILEGTNVRQRRRYSRDAITRRREQVVEHAQLKRARTHNQRADDLEAQAARATAKEDHAGLLRKAAEERHKARKASPRHVSDREVQRRVDERNAANEDVRRQLRTRAIKAAHKHHVPERKGGRLVPLIAQHIIKPTREDARAYATELDAQAPHLDTAQRIANRELAHELRKAADNPKVDFARLNKAARGFADVMAPVEKELVDRGLIDARQAERSRLIPYAVRHMGASHDGERIVASHGGPITNTEIRQHMAANGFTGEPAYLSQAPNARGARNFFMSGIQRHTISSASRTGEATRLGTFSTATRTCCRAGRQGARSDRVGSRLQADGRRVRDPPPQDGGGSLTFKTKKEADKFVREMQARRLEAAASGQGQPVSRPQADDLHAVLDEVNPTRRPMSRSSRRWSPPSPATEARGPWVVMHDVAAARFQSHLKLLGSGAALKGCAG
jgi:hypothetical protein